MTRTRRPRLDSAVLILAAYPRRLAAERAASLLVQERVLACATLVPGARAFYMWKGKRHAETSTLLQGKTTRARAQDAIRRLRETHPDEVPEILVFDITGGDPDYLEWVARGVKRS